jgi:hypothetical protein
LEIEALVRHAHGDAADARQGIEPRAERPESTVRRRAGKTCEAEGRSQKLAALVEHASLDDLVRLQQQRWGDRKTERFGGLEIDYQLKLR